MGLFKTLFSSTPSVLSYQPKSIQEAYMAVLYPIVAIDGDVGDEEINRLSWITMQTGLFEGIDLTPIVIEVGTSITKYGEKTLIDAGIKLINQKYRPQLFCFCAELILADGVVTEEEEQILDYLAKAIAISDDTAKKIVEVMMIKMGINL